MKAEVNAKGLEMDVIESVPVQEFCSMHPTDTEFPHPLIWRFSSRMKC